MKKAPKGGPRGRLRRNGAIVRRRVLQALFPALTVRGGALLRGSIKTAAQIPKKHLCGKNVCLHRHNIKKRLCL
ncbi:MAG: hypothetical protein DBY36_05275 [Clostridiales bacterium]|nr:MAG: hypothetical protein DBY36_05275 [Clostridiales bacterium]